MMSYPPPPLSIYSKTFSIAFSAPAAPTPTLRSIIGKLKSKRPRSSGHHYSPASILHTHTSVESLGSIAALGKNSGYQLLKIYQRSRVPLHSLASESSI